jgi:hypothetical protein
MRYIEAWLPSKAAALLAPAISGTWRCWVYGDMWRMYNQLRDVYVVICVILLADGSEYTEQACGGDEYPL